MSERFPDMSKVLKDDFLNPKDPGPGDITSNEPRIFDPKFIDWKLTGRHRYVHFGPWVLRIRKYRSFSERNGFKTKKGKQFLGWIWDVYRLSKPPV